MTSQPLAQQSIQRFLPARLCDSAAAPWIPASPEKSWKPLRFLANGCGFVELLRMVPGAVMPLHRHTGEVHAFNLSGERQLCTGEVVGPGGYVHEPAGHRDWWKVVGDEPMIALVVVMGTVEFLGPGTEIKSIASAHSQRQAYQEFCRHHGLQALDLVETPFEGFR